MGAGQGEPPLSSELGEKTYRKYVKTTGRRFEIDEEKVVKEARFDGTWVLQTDLEIPAGEAALKYKALPQNLWVDF